MKKIIEHFKDYWKTYVASLVCGACLLEHLYLDNWQAAIYTMIIFFLLSACFELDKAYKRLFSDFLDLKAHIYKQNKMLKEMHDKYAELGVKYIQLRKKYEPEELVKEIEVKPKRRPRRWQKKDTQTSR